MSLFALLAWSFLGGFLLGILDALRRYGSWKALGV